MSKIMNEVNKSTIASAEFEPIMVKRQISKLEQLDAAIFGDSKEVIAVLRLSGVLGKVSTVKSGFALESLNKLIEKLLR